MRAIAYVRLVVLESVRCVVSVSQAVAIGRDRGILRVHVCVVGVPDPPPRHLPYPSPSFPQGHPFLESPEPVHFLPSLGLDGSYARGTIMGVGVQVRACVLSVFLGLVYCPAFVLTWPRAKRASRPFLGFVVDSVRCFSIRRLIVYASFVPSTALILRLIVAQLSFGFHTRSLPMVIAASRTRFFVLVINSPCPCL